MRISRSLNLTAACAELASLPEGFWLSFCDRESPWLKLVHSVQVCIHGRRDCKVLLVRRSQIQSSSLYCFRLLWGSHEVMSRPIQAHSLHQYAVIAMTPTSSATYWKAGCIVTSASWQHMGWMARQLQKQVSANMNASEILARQDLASQFHCRSALCIAAAR